MTEKPKSQYAQIFSLAFLALIAIVIWVIAVYPQSSSISKPSPTLAPEPAFTPKPTSIPFVMPEGDFEMSWDTYNSQYNSLGGIVTIRKQGSRYTEKIVMSDGSSANFDLVLISEGKVIKLDGHFGVIAYSLPPHDYMQIESNGWLGFYDEQGLIYSVPPLK